MPETRLGLVIDGFRSRPRLSKHVELRRLHRSGKLLDEGQGQRRLAVMIASGNAHEATVVAAFTNDGPFVRIECGVANARELQECNVRRELAGEREAVASAEVFGERRGAEGLAPRQS